MLSTQYSKPLQTLYKSADCTDVYFRSFMAYFESYYSPVQIYYDIRKSLILQVASFRQSTVCNIILYHTLCHPLHAWSSSYIFDILYCTASTLLHAVLYSSSMIYCTCNHRYFRTILEHIYSTFSNFAHSKYRISLTYYLIQYCTRQVSSLKSESNTVLYHNIKYDTAKSSEESCSCLAFVV